MNKRGRDSEVSYGMDGSVVEEEYFDEETESVMSPTKTARVNEVSSGGIDEPEETPALVAQVLDSFGGLRASVYGRWRVQMGWSGPVADAVIELRLPLEATEERLRLVVIVPYVWQAEGGAPVAQDCILVFRGIRADQEFISQPTGTTALTKWAGYSVVMMYEDDPTNVVGHGLLMQPR